MLLISKSYWTRFNYKIDIVLPSRDNHNIPKINGSSIIQIGWNENIFTCYG